MLFDLSDSVDVKKAKQKFDQLLEKGDKIKIVRYHRKRTNDQNAYLHVCIGLISIEVGLTLDEGKTEVKRALAAKYPWAKYQKKGKWFLTSTADYDKEQAMLFIDFMREDLADAVGIYIPTPDEWREQQFKIEQELNRLEGWS